MLALAVSSFWQVLPYVSFRNSEGIKGLISLVESVCIALIAMFAGDLIYSHFVPNVGEGITDYTPPTIGTVADADEALPEAGDAPGTEEGAAAGGA